MTLRAKLEEVINKIENDIYSGNDIYLYPLNKYMDELMYYFDYKKSDNETFNAYLNQVQLPSFSYYIEIFEKKTSTNSEHDVKSIKEGVAYWHSHFKSAFKTFSVVGLDNEFNN